MDLRTGRVDHIEDILIHLHTGGWFGWSDPTNKVYANLIIKDDTKDKPTEKSLTDALAKQQSDFDSQAYARNRAAEYPDMKDQLDYIFHNGVAKWKTDIIEPVKTKWPKDNSGPVEEEESPE